MLRKIQRMFDWEVMARVFAMATDAAPLQHRPDRFHKVALVRFGGRSSNRQSNSYPAWPSSSRRFVPTNSRFLSVQERRTTPARPTCSATHRGSISAVRPRAKPTQIAPRRPSPASMASASPIGGLKLSPPDYYQSPARSGRAARAGRVPQVFDFRPKRNALSHFLWISRLNLLISSRKASHAEGDCPEMTKARRSRAEPSDRDSLAETGSGARGWNDPMAACGTPESRPSSVGSSHPKGTIDG
jgi:hypothetical protein